MDRLHAAWREAVFALYLAEGKIEPAVVENMRSWPHSGFHVDQSVHLAADDRACIERLMQYMTRCPFSLSRLVKVTKTGEVVYKAEKDACRAFPDPQSNELARGTKRNFQILSPLDFLAEFTQHIPPKGAHLIRYYGWYSNKARGMRKKAAEAAAGNLPSPSGRAAGGEGSTRRASQTWAMLIKRVYEVDPLECPKCGGTMKVIAFIEPPQREVIEKILRHCGLWNPVLLGYGGGPGGVFRWGGGVDFRPRSGLGPSDALLRRALGSDLRRLRRPIRRQFLILVNCLSGSGLRIACDLPPCVRELPPICVQIAAGPWQDFSKKPAEKA